ncbi:MAG: hypothetical protein ABIQ12_01515 [Opitutaceae bacterium]
MRPLLEQTYALRLAASLHSRLPRPTTNRQPGRRERFPPRFWFGGEGGFRCPKARVTPPPNPSLLELAAVVGEDNARNLVRTFLRDFPSALGALPLAERKTQHRLIHSMKSSTRVVGASDFSQKLAGLEAKLAEASLPDLTSAEIQHLVVEFEAIATPLREFVGT